MSKIKVTAGLVCSKFSPGLANSTFSLHPHMDFPLCVHNPSVSLCV